MRTLLLLTLLVAAAAARTVRVRPVSASAALDQDSRQAEYYAEEPEDDGGPVLVSRQDAYGRATGAARASPARFKPETAREPPVQTIRNYNKLNDDGSFTFGYEAADGSFKEETRGTDCVVRGKYGYVDPDGNKREFSYVSGNPCDPNAPKEEEEQPSSQQESGEENLPANANYPVRGLARPAAAQRPRPRPQAPTAVFQQSYNVGSGSEEVEEEEEEPARAPVRTTSRPRPVTTTYRPQATFSASTAAPQPAFRSQPTPAPKAAFVTQPPTARTSAVRITPRPASASVEPATTYRPQLLEASPSPSFPAFRPTAGPLDFDEEFKRFQLENNVVSSTAKPTKGGSASVTANPIYSTELVFDPSSGQYNTVLYQSLPNSQEGQLNLKGRLQPYVDSPFAAVQPPGPFPPNPFLQQRPLQYQQQLFQQNQAQLVQQSQQLFAAQQQKKQKPRPETPAFAQSQFPASLLRQDPQTFQPQPAPQPQQQRQPPARAAPPARFAYEPQGVQSFYYVNPQAHNSVAAGQIDAFLRGHSLAV